MELVYDLALILIVASVVSIIFKRLNQPLVLGYIVAGFLVSPHMTYMPTVGNAENVEIWADIGVMFLMFALGLEFSFKKIVNMGMAPIIASLTIIICMMAIGTSVGYLFGWDRMDCIFLGGMLCMSSTTIIYKAFDDQGLLQQRFASLVMSVLILEDVLAIVLMVMLGAVASGGSGGGGEMLMSILRIVFFIVLWFVVGLFFIPWLLRSVRKFINNEMLLVFSLSLCCAMVIFSERVGFSPAFGAFVMGSIFAETIEAEKIARLVEPVKNLFGAIFFVSVGMLVDPQILSDYAMPILGLVATIIIGQAVFGTMGFLLSGQSLKTAMRCGFSMAQIGEFSFIIASLGLSLGVISHFLYPVVVAVSVLTIFLTPYMIRLAVPSYDFMERRMPKVWIKRLNRLSDIYGGSAQETTLWRSLLLGVLLNIVIFGTLSIAGVAVMFMAVKPVLFGMLPAVWAKIALAFGTILFISPFLRAMIMKKAHSEESRKLWTENRKNRLPLTFVFVVRVLIAVSIVFYVVEHVFHFASALIVSGALLIVLVMIGSRSLQHNSIRLERMFVKNLQSREIAERAMGRRRPLFEGRLLDRSIHISEVEVPADSLWAGRSLAELSLGRRFGVHVSSIIRGGHRINIPGGDTIIFPLDRMNIIASDEQASLLSATIKQEVMPEDHNIENREMKLHQLTLSSRSKLIGQTLATSGLREKYGVMLVGLDEGQENLTQVDAAHVFRPGDVLWVVGEKGSIEKLAII